MRSFSLAVGGSGTSVLGLGLAALGRPGYINVGHGRDLDGARDPEALERHAAGVLDLAWEQGIRYFDAARSYGRAEEFLGRWLAARAIAPDEVTVASKWGYEYTAGWRVDAPVHEVKDHTLATFLRQRKESAERLGDQLDLYQIHSATLDSGVLDDAAVHAALAELRATGVRIGITLSGPRQSDALRRALAIRWEGERLFDTVQATWNLLEPSAGPALAEAKAAGMRVIVKEALANGRLALRRGRSDSAFVALEPLRTESERRGVAPDALALAAALAQPWTDVVLSGAATREQLRSNLDARSLRWDEELARHFDGLREAADRYWETRARLPWN